MAEINRYTSDIFQYDSHDELVMSYFMGLVLDECSFIISVFWTGGRWFVEPPGEMLPFVGRLSNSSSRLHRSGT